MLVGRSPWRWPRPEGRRCWSGGRENRCAETAALVADVGGQSLVRPADVTDEAAVEAVFAQAADELEGIDAAILAAGVGRYGPIESYPLADWEETLATNLTGPFLCAKAAIPHLRRNGGGAIVAVSSGRGQAGLSPARRVQRVEVRTDGADAGARRRSRR